MAITAGKQYFRFFDPMADEEALNELANYGVGEVRGEPKSHTEWTWINGMDYEIPGIFLFTSSQFILRKRSGHEDFYVQPATDFDCTFIVRKSFLEDYLTTSLAGMVGFLSNAVWLGPSVSYTPPFYEDIAFGAKFNVFTGKETSRVGMYQDQSSLVFNLRWLF
jgi:hypothetical protein